MTIDFELYGQITEAETFAIGPSIRELRELRIRFGHGRWRKRKGVANVRLRVVGYWELQGPKIKIARPLGVWIGVSCYERLS